MVKRKFPSNIDQRPNYLLSNLSLFQYWKMHLGNILYNLNIIKGWKIEFSIKEGIKVIYK